MKSQGLRADRAEENEELIRRQPPKTVVVDLHGHVHDPGFFDVYVGHRQYGGGWRLPESPLANPFKIGRDGTLTEVVAKYRAYLLGRPDLLALLPALRGKVLGCWCAPEPCHAYVIAELADAGMGGQP